MQFNNEGSILATIDKGELKIWNAKSYEMIS